MSLVVRMVSLRYGLVLGLSSRFGVSARFRLSVCVFCRFPPFPSPCSCRFSRACFFSFSCSSLLLLFFPFLCSPSRCSARGGRGALRGLRASVPSLRGSLSVVPCGGLSCLWRSRCSRAGLVSRSRVGRSARGGSCLRLVASCGRFAFLVPFLGRTRVLVRLAVLVRFRC